MTVAGAGDGQALRLLGKLRDAGYRGFLALEPHLGCSNGAQGMKRAAQALRSLMKGRWLYRNVSSRAGPRLGSALQARPAPRVHSTRRSNA